VLLSFHACYASTVWRFAACLVMQVHLSKAVEEVHFCWLARGTQYSNGYLVWLILLIYSLYSIQFSHQWPAPLCSLLQRRRAAAVQCCKLILDAEWPSNAVMTCCRQGAQCWLTVCQSLSGSL